MTVFQMCVWRMGPHHPVGLTEMQITHHLFYLQAFPSSRRNICKLTWPGWTAGWGLSGFDERFTTFCLLIFSYFCFLSGACWLYAEKSVCACQMNSHGTGKLGPYGTVSTGELEVQVALHQERGLPALRRSRHGGVVTRECGSWQCPVPPLPAEGQFVTWAFKVWKEAKREGKQRIWTGLALAFLKGRQVFVPTIVLRDNEAQLEVTGILFACLVGMATAESVGPEYCRELALGTQ